MTFRSDIEGLRGIAVLLVVLAHAGVPYLSGGFVGVDVFFVISGYLITGLLASEIERAGQIDLWNFYARRARRLAPALLVMLVLVLAFAYVYFPRVELHRQIDSGAWAAVWLSNMYFAVAQFDYFGPSAQDSLFLHTWSLGVEEQFYLLWPFVMTLAWRHLSGRSLWLFGAASGSLLLCLAWAMFDATAAYYAMPSRLWQLALGALAYYYAVRPKVVGVLRKGWAGPLGLVLLAASLVYVDSSTAYPSAWALLPTLAAGLLLISGGIVPEGPVVWMLSRSPLRLAGRISYSWYLWHWPFLAMMPALGLGRPGATETLVLVLVSFLVGLLSYAYVEQPFRSRTKSAKATVAASLLASATLAAILVLLRSQLPPERAPGDLGATELERKVSLLVKLPSVYKDKRCDQWYLSAELVPCEIPAGAGGAGKIILIADSVGAQWLPAIETMATSWDMRLVVLTKSSCPIVDEPFVYAQIHRRFTECEEWRARALAYVEATRPALVLVGSTSGYGFTADQWRQGSARILRVLAQDGTPVVVLAPTPILPFHGPRCLKARGSLVAGQIIVNECTTGLEDVEREDVIDDLSAAVREVRGAHLVYFNDLVCPDRECPAYRDGQLVFRDDQHLNGSFVQSLAAEFEARLKESLGPGMPPPPSATPSDPKK